MGASDEKIMNARGILIAKILIVASLFLPYLIDLLDAESYWHIGIYAIVWAWMLSPDYSAGGITPIGLLLFPYWLPYVFVSYVAYNYARGNYSDTVQYVIRVALATLLAILLTLPMGQFSRASINGVDYYSMAIPIPIVSILALALIPILRPKSQNTLWTDDSDQEDAFGEVGS